MGKPAGTDTGVYTEGSAGLLQEAHALKQCPTVPRMFNSPLHATGTRCAKTHATEKHLL